MALVNTVINNILPSFAFDAVAVFTQDFIQIFQSARIFKANIREEAKVMEHPVETGATIVDHRIILPIEIELHMAIHTNDYQNVYNQIQENYYNSTLLVVQTRSGIYENQLIQSMPHEESPDTYDLLTLILNLKQVQFVTAQYGTAPKNPTNVNTVNRGAQQSTEPSPKQSGTILGQITGRQEKEVNPKKLPA